MTRLKTIADLVAPITRQEAYNHYKRKKASGSEPTKSQQENKKNSHTDGVGRPRADGVGKPKP